MKRYPKYKDSGQSWVGRVPAHWELKPNRSLFRDVGQTVENKGEGFLLLSLTQNGLIPRDMENPTGKFPADFATYQKVKRGDLVFCLFDVDETPRTVGISSHDGMVTGAYTVVRCYDERHARYLYWFYLSLDDAKRLKPLYKGLRKVVPAETFRSIKSPVPPLDEADKICCFIESQVDSMNKAISTQERMIELLKERRSAIITQAVTKGLNPKAKMKDSGVPWLGQVPQHWEVKRAKYLLRQLNRPAGGETEIVTAFRDGVVTRRSKRREDGFTISAKEIGYQGVKSGDFVLHSMDAAAGCVGVSDSDGKCSPVYAVCSAGPNANQWYLSDVFRVMAAAGWIAAHSKGIRQRSTDFRFDELAVQFFPLPPRSEQDLIISFLRKITLEIDSAISAQERMIELLKERRSVIITQAVTGQIDVR